MLRDKPFANGEVYHVFNRGAHKQKIFAAQEDYARFLLLAYLGNSNNPARLRDTLEIHRGSTFGEVFLKEEVDDPLVDILAYALMPNHYHLVLKQKVDNGISMFMKKLGTGYTMSFNTKYEHSGVIFQGRFKSKYIDSNAYFRYIFAYVHLNPVALVEPGWQEHGIKDQKRVRKFLNEYQYNSYYDYNVEERPQSKVLSRVEIPDFLRTQNDLEEMLHAFNSPKVQPLGSFGNGGGKERKKPGLKKARKSPQWSKR